MDHELSPYPTSLFETKHLFRKADKAKLLDALRGHLTTHSAGAGLLDSKVEVEHYVLDGGSLLHRLKWTEGRTYDSIAEMYASFAVNQYGNATVIFDGYSEGPTTKDNTHKRRRGNQFGNRVHITDATVFSGNKEDFLANDANKQDLIHLISRHMRAKGCHVIQAEGDADVDIAKAAVLAAESKSTTLIGEDTDLLVLLLFHTPADDVGKKINFHLDKKNPTVMYDVKVIKQILGDELCTNMLFLHAFTGCDTTSRIYGIGKKSVLHKFINEDQILKACGNEFCSPDKLESDIEQC